MLFNKKIIEYIKKVESNKGKISFFINMKKQSILNDFKNEWIDIMVNLGLYNKLYNVYTPNNIEITDYGIKCDIFIVHGLNFDKLNAHKDTIQENLGGMIVFNNHKASNFINAKIIFCPKNDLAYKVIKQTETYMSYIGNDYSGKPIFVNLKDYPHDLISGGTRSGKSKMNDVMITNSVVNILPEDLQLYLFQIAKSDLVLYEDLIHTRAFCDTLDKCEIGLNYIVNELMIQRDKEIRPYRKKALADNYIDYNQLTHTNKMPTVLVIFDEMSSLFNSKGDESSIKKQKQSINSMIEKIAQFGASLGVFLICSLQRPTMDNLSPFIKAQSTTMTSFRQNNSKSSEVATDDPELALGLKQREFIYKQDKWDYGIVPLIDNKEIYRIIKPYLKPSHRTLFDDLKKMKNRDGIKKGKEKIEYNKTEIKTESEILKENISKIDGFIPYVNPTGMIITQDRKLQTKTSKSIKKGKEKL